MERRPPEFTKYTTERAAELPVGRWEAGFSAVPDELLGQHLEAVLVSHGFDVDRPEDVRTGILTSGWKGHPASALVVATSLHRQPSEPFVVSETAVGQG